MEGRLINKLILKQKSIADKYGGMYCEDQIHNLKKGRFYIINESKASDKLGKSCGNKICYTEIHYIGFFV